MLFIATLAVALRQEWSHHRHRRPGGEVREAPSLASTLNPSRALCGGGSRDSWIVSLPLLDSLLDYYAAR